jgi:hypothetical protein
LGQCNAELKRKIYMPAFSKGGFITGDFKNYENYYNQEPEQSDLECKKLTEKLKLIDAAFAEQSITESQKIKFILALFENAMFYYDFDSNAIRRCDEFRMTQELFIQYEEYLTCFVGLTLEELREIKGNIFIADTILSGAGLIGFIKILRELGLKAGTEIMEKLQILNFCEIQKLPEILGIQVKNLVVPRNIWCELAYNYLPDESFFFPPWAWKQKILWKEHAQNTADEQKIVERYYQEMDTFISEVHRSPAFLAHSSKLLCS